MAKFSAKSRDALATCDKRLEELFLLVVDKYDCKILVGHRSRLKQNRAFKRGASTKEWPNGRHNSSPSLAVDVAPYPVDWKNTKRFYHFAGYVQGKAAEMGIKIRWGGDWDRDFDLDDQDFMDLIHFEIPA